MLLHYSHRPTIIALLQLSSIVAQVFNVTPHSSRIDIARNSRVNALLISQALMFLATQELILLPAQALMSVMTERSTLLTTRSSLS
ncbi:hypothetical protein C8R42DRAFT_674758 [Lentinula raphanica]|nr:hypothetical protein C8R42DRAFT_674758 [Lentinula raphanica]